MEIRFGNGDKEPVCIIAEFKFVNYLNSIKKEASMDNEENMIL